jgi:malonate transporter MadM subunit
METLTSLLEDNGLVFGFAVVGVLMLIAGAISKVVTKGRFQASAIAIILALILAYFGGQVTGGTKGLGDIAIFSGLTILGGSMLRDFAIIATAYGVDIREAGRAGWAGAVSLFVGVFGSFFVGAVVAYLFGYRDPESLTTIGAGAATYIVGPVTGTAIGAAPDVIAMSVAAGLTKAVIVMVATPLFAKFIGLDNPKSAVAYGGLMGTTSGVAGGLAATDARLVPYGAMSATFYTGLGCLLGPSVFYFIMLAVFG